MQTLRLPFSTAAQYLVACKLPMGLVQLPSLAGTTYEKLRGTPVHTDPSPAQTVPVILALYYARAYPSYYYQHPVQVDVTVSLDI